MQAQSIRHRRVIYRPCNVGILAGEKGQASKGSATGRGHTPPAQGCGKGGSGAARPYPVASRPSGKMLTYVLEGGVNFYEQRRGEKHIGEWGAESKPRQGSPDASHGWPGGQHPPPFSLQNAMSYHCRVAPTVTATILPKSEARGQPPRHSDGQSTESGSLAVG